MKNAEFKKLLQAELIAAGFITTQIVSVGENDGHTVITLNGNVSMSNFDDRLLINWLDGRFSNGVRTMEDSPSNIIINTPNEKMDNEFVKKTIHDYGVRAKFLQGNCIELKMNSNGTFEPACSGPIVGTINRDYIETLGPKIMTAFNETYAKNIDPVGIQSLIESSEALLLKLRIMTTDQWHMGEDRPLRVKLSEALNNLKIKQEVPNDNN